MRYLLDKVTARLIVQGLYKLAEARNPTSNEVIALDFLIRTQRAKASLFILPQTHNVLSKLGHLPWYTPSVQEFFRQTDLIMPARYFTRWSRRLRDYGFMPEDAAVLAMATFGTDQAHDIIGLHIVATFDQPRINRWAENETIIQARLDSIIENLYPPYNQVKIPEVLHPNNIIT